MNKRFLITAAFLGALSVLLGAFAAHKLKDIFEPSLLQVFETAVKYQMYHSLALVAAGILHKEFPAKQIIWAGNLFLAGIILFSGSLYAICIMKHQGISPGFAGPLTPVGGLCFISGWLLLAVGLSKKTAVSQQV